MDSEDFDSSHEAGYESDSDSMLVTSSANEANEAEVVIDSKYVPFIIGRRGKVLERIKQKIGVNINVYRGKVTTVFEIHGDSDGTKKARAEILKLCDYAAKGLEDAEKVILEVSIPPQFVGLIIGLKGKFVKQLKARTNTRIISPTDTDAEPIFKIIGKPEDALKAKEQIMDAIAKAPAAKKRHVFVDAGNVCLNHGNAHLYSTNGLMYAVTYFLQKGHQVSVLILEDRLRLPFNCQPDGRLIIDQGNLFLLEMILPICQGALVKVPSRNLSELIADSRVMADSLLIELASQVDGAILTNANISKVSCLNSRFRKIVKRRLLYAFVGDQFLLVSHPNGESDKTADQILAGF